MPVTPLLKRISISPDVSHGQACIRGTRIPVHQIVRMLANRLTFWLATIPGGLLAVGALFLSVSLVARRVPTLGLAKVATLVALAATYLTALTLAGSK